MYQRFAGICCSRIGTCFIEQFAEVDDHVGLSGMMGFPSETCWNDGRYCLVIHERRPTRQAGNNLAHDDCTYVIDSLLVRYTNGLPDVLRASRRSARPASGKRFRIAVARRRRRSTARGHRALPPLLPPLASCSLKGKVSSPPVPARQDVSVNWTSAAPHVSKEIQNGSRCPVFSIPGAGALAFVIQHGVTLLSPCGLNIPVRRNAAALSKTLV